MPPSTEPRAARSPEDRKAPCERIITLDLTLEIEQGLLAQARGKGLSLFDYLQQIVQREAHVAPRDKSAPVPENSPIRGLNREFERNRDYGRF